MKSYTQYQDEITNEGLYRGLLLYGMFSEKLPPIFTMESFWAYCKELKQPFEKKYHDFVYFESMRNTGVPRSCGIPVPMAYQRLCASLRDNWPKIQDHFRAYTANQKHKVSRIHLRRIKDSGKLFEMNYKKWWIDSEPTEDLIVGKRYVVKSDISTFFPSIYTHSIPWALIGKEIAKEDRSEKHWYNQIDRLCGAMKSGETHGLLIGPHTSNLISEIILSVVDHTLIEQGFSFIRNIDDYECYVETYERGQEFITALKSALREYDLLINLKKTNIEELPKATVDNWVTKISDAIAIQLGVDELKRKHIKPFMDTVIGLIDEAHDIAVLKYAMKVLAEKKMNPSAQDYYEKTIMHLAAIYPYAAQFIDQYLYSTFETNAERIKQYASIIYLDGLRSRNYEAVYYAIFFAIKYGFQLEGITVEDAINSEDCLMMLFTLLYYRQNRDSEAIKQLKKKAAELKVKKNETMDKNWLFCFEALSEGSLNGEWKPMKAYGVSFIKPEYRG